ncbi:hypothetical protein Rhe02_18430 [Rhizocola hellebori]|uniref:DUF1996 domain-containing protein n=1 Tax=Rhizocola hellebori TaxID=1392758 RepID=A0A8J3VF01_9ACTN|nr:DUF1996 domain-containing protein [Rhizocola hellebori]GIH03776.1 hypothetical protein Rhe02_18430 [Rhizocola hellebori]
MPLRLAALIVCALVFCLAGEPQATGFYVDLDRIPATQVRPATASFGQDCGRNENGHRNSDNIITSPGMSGAAHHVHEYVGNLTTHAYSTDESLLAGGTTCGSGDLSAYYWPVLRISHRIVAPQQVRIAFYSNGLTDVVAMPQFLRISTGDARAVTSGGRYAHAQWSCSGAPNRVSPRYPLCPEGQLVTRTFTFPSCWDGLRKDSPNHRDHVVFPAASGACPPKTFPIPRLEITVSYQVPHRARYRIDGFPEQGGSPATDHSDFVAIIPEPLMREILRALGTKAA